MDLQTYDLLLRNYLKHNNIRAESTPGVGTHDKPVIFISILAG